MWLWTLAVAGGVLAALTWPGAPILVGSGVCVCTAGAVFCRRWRVPFLVSMGMCFWATLCAAHVLSNRLVAPTAGDVRGCVASGVWLRDDRVRFVFQASEFNGQSVRWRLELSAYDGTRLPRPGECWRLSVRLKPVRSLLNPLGADGERRLFVQRWSGRGVARLDATAVRVTPVNGQPLLRIRLWLSGRIRFLAGEGAAWPLIVALTVGLREPLPESLRETLAATGTGHLVSISGLHIGLVAALGWAVARHSVAPVMRTVLPRWWTRHRGDLRVGPAAALTAACAYAALAGFALPTRRALIMLAVVLLATQCRCRIPLPASLCVAFVLILAVNPLAVLDTGLWLSFVAVGALATLATRQTQIGLAAPWIAFVGLWPVVAAGLGRVAWSSPLANAVWVPLFSLVVIPIALLALGAVGAPADVAAPIYAVLAWVIEGALYWLRPLATWSETPSWLPAASVWQVFLAALGVAMLLGAVARWRVRVLALALCLPLLVARQPGPAYGAAAVSVLDVAHGLAVVVQTRRHVVVYDTGGRWGTTDAGARVVVPELAARGVRAVHTVVVSHGDLDHRGGSASLRAAFPITHWISGEPGRGARAAACTAGQRWRLDGVLFEVLHPRTPGQWAGNNASCVIRVRTRHARVLLTGDLERLGEVSLLHGGTDLSADVLIGQHHGSKTSSSQRFVAATSPDLVVFSTAHGNRWSLPAREVTSRWTAAGAITCATSARGAVTITLDGRPVVAALSAARRARPALWRWTPELVAEGWQAAFRVRTGRDILRASC